ncbi:DUF1272 domain-containing protein [Mesorhizobium sp. YC-39]
MKPGCGCCDRDLSLDNGEALICLFACTMSLSSVIGRSRMERGGW